MIDPNFDIVQNPEMVAFPSLAFKIGAWFWNENAYVIKDSDKASKSSLNELADGKFLNYAQLTYALTKNLQSLKNRANSNELILSKIGSETMKRGEGVTCELKDKTIGYAVPICMLDFKKPYCGCEGRFEIRTCPYGRSSNGQCRNSAIIKYLSLV